MINKCMSNAKNVVVIDFQNYRLRCLARDYVGILIKYGVETASLWSMDLLSDRIEIKQFNRFVEQEMRKFGFKMPRKE